MRSRFSGTKRRRFTKRRAYSKKRFSTRRSRPTRRVRNAQAKDQVRVKFTKEFVIQLPAVNTSTATVNLSVNPYTALTTANGYAMYAKIYDQCRLEGIYCNITPLVGKPDPGDGILNQPPASAAPTFQSRIDRDSGVGIGLSSAANYGIPNLLNGDPYKPHKRSFKPYGQDHKFYNPQNGQQSADPTFPQATSRNAGMAFLWSTIPRAAGQVVNFAKVLIHGYYTFRTLATLIGVSNTELPVFPQKGVLIQWLDETGATVTHPVFNDMTCAQTG